ncbi:accessory factor UbiK family protein [Paramagnetospirillum caucaseum]|nr:accessory factor UbiK family protein [Paramagnetospirillum caucaseum]
MQSQKPFFDDLARVASGALGALSGLRAEMEAMMRQQFERFTSSLDLVPREEFEVVRAMAIKAREDNEAQAARINELEARLAALSAAPAPAPTRPKAAPKPKAPPKAVK